MTAADTFLRFTTLTFQPGITFGETVGNVTGDPPTIDFTSNTGEIALFNAGISSVPEPVTTCWLAGVGLAGFAAARRAVAEVGEALGAVLARAG